MNRGGKMRVEKELGSQTPCLVLQTLEANLHLHFRRLMNSIGQVVKMF